MENGFDRAARRLRPLIFVAGLIAVPVFAVSYYYAFRLMLDALPLWAFLGIAASHAFIWLAAASLHDWQSERRSMRGRSR